jgi:hypothetical protein
MNELIAALPFEIYEIVRALLVVFLIIYTIIAGMVIKQIGLMARTIKGPNNKYLYFVAYAHLAIVIVTLVVTLIAL